MLSIDIPHSRGFATVLLNGNIILDGKANTTALDEIRLEAASHFLLERGIRKEDRQYWAAVASKTDARNLFTNPKHSTPRH